MAEEEESISKSVKEESILVGVGFCANAQPGNAAVTDVRGGKIARIRPLPYDWKYQPEQFNPWEMTARGKSFKPLLKSTLPPYSIGYKKRVYSPNRVRYPLKRVDLDPNGERNPQNRGSSKFERISWDEAQVEKVDLDELKAKCPEAFARPFHPDAGLCIKSFLE